jgi:hypothetical protein
LESKIEVSDPVIQWVASQLKLDASAWAKYGRRDETRREHFQELRAYLDLSPFGLSNFRFLVHGLTDLAMQTDKSLVLAYTPWRHCGNGKSSCRRSPSLIEPVLRPLHDPTDAYTGLWSNR